jgi:hypothetical protein
VTHCKTSFCLADWTQKRCNKACETCFPTLPLSQLWDAPANYFYGTGSQGYAPQLGSPPVVNLYTRSSAIDEGGHALRRGGVMVSNELQGSLNGEQRRREEVSFAYGGHSCPWIAESMHLWLLLSLSYSLYLETRKCSIP